MFKFKIVAVVRDAVLLCATRCFMQSVMLCCCAQCCALCSRQDGTRVGFMSLLSNVCCHYVPHSLEELPNQLLSSYQLLVTANAVTAFPIFCFQKARWKNSERSVCSAFLAGHVIEQFCSVYTIFLTSWTFEQFLQRPACAFDFLLL